MDQGGGAVWLATAGEPPPLNMVLRLFFFFFQTLHLCPIPCPKCHNRWIGDISWGLKGSPRLSLGSPGKGHLCLWCPLEGCLAALSFHCSEGPALSGASGYHGSEWVVTDSSYYRLAREGFSPVRAAANPRPSIPPQALLLLEPPWHHVRATPAGSSFCMQHV